jgi:CheY-like chemotaxis protein
MLLRVRDTGMGISADVLPRIFDLFVQGGQAIDRAQGGLGLGLSIVKSLVERHGGRVSAHSEGPDRGSEFVVALPLLEHADAGERVSDAARPPAAAAAPLAARVLIVDDNHDAAEMVATALAIRGFDTRVAHEGVEALRIAEEYRPDVAFLDVGLPVMDGYELAARLRAIPALDRIRLIAVTGYGQESDRRRSAEAGFHHHLVKPVDLDALVALAAV